MRAADLTEPNRVSRSRRMAAPSVPPELQVVDLFCGAGGLSLGFEMAGFQSVLGIDAWEPATTTFRSHHPSATVVLQDIQDVDPEELPELANLAMGDVGVLCGGPPCQGFSKAGRSLADDPRNFLYRHFLYAVESLLPRWVVMENVPALLENVEVARALVNDFRSLSVPKNQEYEVQLGVVNAAWFGVPQTRQRLIVLAKRKDVKTKGDFSFKEWMRPLFAQEADLFGSPRYVSVQDAIFDLPDIEAGGGSEIMDYDKAALNEYQRVMRGEKAISAFFQANRLDLPSHFEPFEAAAHVYNHIAQNHSDLLIERFRNIPPGGSKEDLRRNRPDLLPPEGHPEQGLTYGRLWLDRPATTIPANYSRPSGNRSIHPTSARLITPREALRLSSFPDYYRLSGGKVAQREQVGNAVPPLLSYHIAQKIRKHTV